MFCGNDYNLTDLFIVFVGVLRLLIWSWNEIRFFSFNLSINNIICMFVRYMMLNKSSETGKCFVGWELSGAACWEGSSWTAEISITSDYDEINTGFKSDFSDEGRRKSEKRTKSLNRRVLSNKHRASTTHPRWCFCITTPAFQLHFLLLPRLLR